MAEGKMRTKSEKELYEISGGWGLKEALEDVSYVACAAWALAKRTVG